MKETEVKIMHSGHKHQLTLTDSVTPYENYCSGCLMRMSRLSSYKYYFCAECFEYDLCKSCGELPTKMQHPFHEKHPLTLVPKSPNESAHSYCNICSKRCGDLIFSCSECQFDLDVNRATLMPTTVNYCASGHEEEQQIVHQHRLIPCNGKKEEADFPCCVCQLPINGTIYVCLAWRAIFDKSCTQLPREITHHFHPHHSLTLKDSFVDDTLFQCKACQGFERRFCYRCSECAFSLDVRCASLMPKAIITKSYDDDDDQSLEENHLQEEVVQIPFSHRHDLIPSDISGNFSFSCYACQVSIEEGTVYVCLECRFFLHKSCAQLPPQIEHPFHPPHPLVLTDNVGQYYCHACNCLAVCFKYWCAKCKFPMDVT